MKRPLATLGILGLTAFAVAAPASASDHKVTICHYTESGMYRQIDISTNGLSGHKNHDDDIIPSGSKNPGSNKDGKECAAPVPPKTDDKHKDKDKDKPDDKPHPGKPDDKPYPGKPGEQPPTDYPPAQPPVDYPPAQPPVDYPPAQPPVEYPPAEPPTQELPPDNPPAVPPSQELPAGNPPGGHPGAGGTPAGAGAGAAVMTGQAAAVQPGAAQPRVDAPRAAASRVPDATPAPTGLGTNQGYNAQTAVGGTESTPSWFAGLGAMLAAGLAVGVRRRLRTLPTAG